MTRADRGAAPARHPLAGDLDRVLEQVGELWEEFRGARLFVTGGTGFFGCWLLETFAWANRRLDLGATALVLTRDRDSFARKAPHLAADPALGFHDGDVRDFRFPEGRFTHVVHGAATSAVETFRKVDPLVTFDIVLEGTRRALELAARSGATQFLLVGSGAVYGRQPADLTHVPEDYPGAPHPASPAAALGESKRAAECLCALYAAGRGLEAKIARCFSFVGPYLPLDLHYAAGNFVRDALAGGPIRVGGDGTPVRSYLYAADLAVWLWTILARGRSCRVYNVGSEAAVSIAELARATARTASPELEVAIAGTPVAGAPVERYVPSTARAQRELGLRQTVSLAEAVERTLAYHRRG